MAISLKHSLDWLVEAERYNELVRDASKIFRSSIDQSLVRKVRNMREHHIEHFRGKEYPEFTSRIVVEGMPVEVDPSSTIIFNTAYLLGGVNITPIVERAKVLLAEIIECEKNI